LRGSGDVPRFLERGPLVDRRITDEDLTLRCSAAVCPVNLQEAESRLLLSSDFDALSTRRERGASECPFHGEAAL
jgi:hypothetical protein